jgi:hypothetical protein
MGTLANLYLATKVQYIRYIVFVKRFIDGSRTWICTMLSTPSWPNSKQQINWNGPMNTRGHQRMDHVLGHQRQKESKQLYCNKNQVKFVLVPNHKKASKYHQDRCIQTVEEQQYSKYSQIRFHQYFYSYICKTVDGTLKRHFHHAMF